MISGPLDLPKCLEPQNFLRIGGTPLSVFSRSSRARLFLRHPGYRSSGLPSLISASQVSASQVSNPALPPDCWPGLVEIFGRNGGGDGRWRHLNPRAAKSDPSRGSVPLEILRPFRLGAKRLRVRERRVPKARVPKVRGSEGAFEAQAPMTRGVAVVSSFREFASREAISGRKSGVDSGSRSLTMFRRGGRTGKKKKTVRS